MCWDMSLSRKKSLKNLQAGKKVISAQTILNCSSSLFCFINTIFPLVVSYFHLASLWVAPWQRGSAMV